jgi:hypothetical protein
MTEDAQAIAFAQQLLGQMFWAREHETYDDMPDSLAEWGEWRLEVESITSRLNDLVRGTHYAMAALLSEVEQAALDPDEVLRRAALRIAD